MYEERYGFKLGQRIKSNSVGYFKVVSILKGSVLELISETTGTVVTVAASSARAGTIGDKNYPKFFGKGYQGYGNYNTRTKVGKGEFIKNKYYQTWENMLARCYYQKTSRYSAYGGKGVEVCDEWLNLQNFAKWYEDNYREGYHLDKDIMGDGSIYSPQVCRFVPQAINNLLVSKCNTDRDLPEGVWRVYDSNKYTSAVSSGGYITEQHTIFDTIEEALCFYREEKTRVVRSYAEEYKPVLDVDVYMKLRDYVYEEKL